MIRGWPPGTIVASLLAAVFVFVVPVQAHAQTSNTCPDRAKMKSAKLGAAVPFAVLEIGFGGGGECGAIVLYAAMPKTGTKKPVYLAKQILGHLTGRSAARVEYADSRSCSGFAPLLDKIASLKAPATRAPGLGKSYLSINEWNFVFWFAQRDFEPDGQPISPSGEIEYSGYESWFDEPYRAMVTHLGSCWSKAPPAAIGER